MNLKRLKIKILRFIKYLDANNIRYRLPKNLNQSQKFSIGIFFKVLKNQSTELYYDLITGECYLSNNEINVHIFIEDNNIKVINSIYSYDISIDQQTERYLIRRFELVLNKRRIDFKNSIISKTEHHLLQTYQKILDYRP
jgi:hypothetical protein